VVTSVIVPEGDGRWTDYAGGYRDMLAQRKADLKGRVKAAAPDDKPAKAEASAPQAGKRRLSFKDKHALETLPGEIAALEAKKAVFSRMLDDPDLYTRDRKRFADLSETLSEVESELAAAEERWLELEMLRSEVEG
jgi:ATP-binding cassette subfamily F protein uup